MSTPMLVAQQPRSAPHFAERKRRTAGVGNRGCMAVVCRMCVNMRSCTESRHRQDPGAYAMLQS